MVRYLHPRWIALHVFVLACCVGCVYAGKWQWDVARRHGDLQNYAYAVQWNIFVLFGLGLWAKVIKDAHDRVTGRQRPGPAVNRRPDGGVVPAATYRGYAMPQSSAITVEDPELARYNAYLNALAEHSAEPAPTGQSPEAGNGVRSEGRT